MMRANFLTRFMPSSKALLCLVWFTGLPLLGWAQSNPTSVSGTATNLLVVVSSKTPTFTVTSKDIADLYLGRTRNLPNGQPAIPLDNATANPVRARFYKALTGKAITDINAYWARLLFTGQSSPPQTLPDATALIEAVRNSPGAVAYLEQSQVPNPDALGLKVILSIAAP